MHKVHFNGELCKIELEILEFACTVHKLSQTYIWMQRGIAH